MTDIAIDLGRDGRTFTPVVYDGDLVRDDSMRTAILVSLFTDRQATVEQVAAAGLDTTDLRGCWSDGLTAAPGDRIGSLLWLLDRRKRTPDVLAQAQRYAEESLQWLIDDGMASAVSVVAYFDGDSSDPALDRTALAFDITLQRPDGPQQYRVAPTWEANFAPSKIEQADTDAGQWAAIAAALERDKNIEIPEIYL